MRFIFALFIFCCPLLAKEYTAKVIEVLDGDTIKASIDLGLDISKIETIRLNGIDAYEKNTDKGKEAKKFLIELLDGKTILIDTNHDKREKYGRLLATVILDEENINFLMVKKGYAKPYHGEKRT